MKIDLPSGKYIVAVSGGVDSVALLDILAKQKGLDLVIAHFDHGTRPDIYKDVELVESLAEKYDLDFVGAGAELGEDVSEEHAREARYDFLISVMQDEEADGIITAHHRDDNLETIIFNLLRGTGRKGLTSLGSRQKIFRPLLDTDKSELIEYATKHKLGWNEDSTNKNTDYARNWIRLNLIPKLSAAQKKQLLQLHEKQKPDNQEIDSIIEKLVDTSENKLDRGALLSTSHSVTKEIVAHWLRANGLREFDKKTIERIVHASKTFNPGKKVDVYAGAKVKIEKRQLVLEKNTQ